MSESSHGYNPATAGNIASLPHNFLGVDLQRLEVSANRQRSMADLRQGLEHLNDNFVVASVVANGCRQWEDPDALRHVNRGAALAQLLLEDGVPGFSPDSGGYIADLVDLNPNPPANPSRDSFSAARNDLMETRRSAVLSETWRLSPEEAAYNENAYRGQLDEVLTKAGLSEHFESAVEGLTGAGLEEPTRPLDAKYGAALVALGVGITEG
jgi:hypothetical protein